MGTLVVIVGLLFAPPVLAGQLHSGAELGQVAMLAAWGQEPWASDQSELRDDAAKPWEWGTPGLVYVTSVDSKGKKTCHPTSDPDQLDFIKNGASDVYAKALAFRTFLPVRRGVFVGWEARSKLLTLTATSGFHGQDGKDYSGGNQCVLDLAVSVPVWIASAELVEAGGLWTDRDREVFSTWLATHVYPRVAWASRVRRNNWGAAGSLAARMIARYVAMEHPVLYEEAPVSRSLSATTAVAEHDRMQRDRVGTEWAGDSSCSVYGIQSHGGIPDETRRGAGGCWADDLSGENDSGHNYQTMHVSLLLMHAEVLRQEGDTSLFEMQTAGGDPALLQSILFVIDNPSSGGRSWNWGGRTGALRAALRYYEDPILASQIEANSHLGFRGGRIFPYTQISLRPGP